MVQDPNSDPAIADDGWFSCTWSWLGKVLWSMPGWADAASGLWCPHFVRDRVGSERKKVHSPATWWRRQ